MGCSTGGLGTHSAGCWFSLPHLISNYLNFLCTELYNSSTSTFFLWVSQIAFIQPAHGQGYILIFLDQMHLLFTQVHFLFWQPSRVVSKTALLVLKNYLSCNDLSLLLFVGTIRNLHIFYYILASISKKKWKEKRSLHRTQALLIQYLYSNQILLVHPIVPKHSFLNFFSWHHFRNQPIQSLTISYFIAVFDLIGQFV